MPVVNITRSNSGDLVFEPAEIILDPLGDWVSWANLDETNEHQPTLQGQAKDYWLNDPLPRFVKGQPAATSPPVALTPTTLSSPIIYVDGLDPNAATGTIVIAAGTANQGGSV